MRLCTVKGKKAIFHRFTEFANVIPPGNTVGSHSGGQVSSPVAIVEYENGAVGEERPCHVIFSDTEKVMCELEGSGDG